MFNSQSLSASVINNKCVQFTVYYPSVIKSDYEGPSKLKDDLSYPVTTKTAEMMLYKTSTEKWSESELKRFDWYKRQWTHPCSQCSFKSP